MLVVINYSNEKYEHVRKTCTSTALAVGKADKVIEWSPSMISEFIAQHPEHFSYKRGAGLWLWKPYIVEETLNKMDDGDYLLYVDAGVQFIRSITHLVRQMDSSGVDVMTFELPLLERQFTKAETVKIMQLGGVNIENQILSGYILIRNTVFARNFIHQWLEAMLDIRLCSPDQFTDIPNPPDFIAHREDQSVLSLLVRKNGLEVFRDPSNYGKFPFEYANKRWTYNPKTYTNSHYPVILLSNRGRNPKEYLRAYRMKSLLHILGLYNYTTYSWKYLR